MKRLLPIILVAVTVLLMVVGLTVSRTFRRNGRHRLGLGSARLQLEREYARAGSLQFSD